ncbi:MAG: DUF4405 domain-containing protein [Bdellovibrionales bacterium]|jgi:protein-S-isoprenylcysteine O-methyltransferase Ste14
MPQPPFNSRAFVSAMMAILFVILFVSSVVLLASPPGRIAHESGWTFLSLDKRLWGDIHRTFGILFLAMALWHLASNWRALMNHIRQRSASPSLRPFLGLKREPVLAFLLCLFILIAVLIP